MGSGEKNENHNVSTQNVSTNAKTSFALDAVFIDASLYTCLSIVLVLRCFTVLRYQYECIQNNVKSFTHTDACRNMWHTLFYPCTVHSLPPQHSIRVVQRNQINKAVNAKLSSWFIFVCEREEKENETIREDDTDPCVYWCATNPVINLFVNCRHLRFIKIKYTTYLYERDKY